MYSCSESLTVVEHILNVSVGCSGSLLLKAQLIPDSSPKASVSVEEPDSHKPARENMRNLLCFVGMSI